MKLPITIDEHGDVTTFDSVEAAELYMEAEDVERGEYRVIDGDGRLLALRVDLIVVSILFGFWRTTVKRVRIVEPASNLDPKP